MAETVLRARLNSPPARPPAAQAALPLLDPRGPRARIGGAAAADGLAAPVRPDAKSLFGPRGVALPGRHGPLWIADTGHHRLLGWARVPDHDDAPADWLIGQPEFMREGRNAKGAPGAASLNVPTGICACGDGLAVADAWNHRVLIWREVPTGSHVPADLVLGQADFAATQANRGQQVPAADSLFWPYGVHWDGVRLWVADTGNRRVLMWDELPRRHGLPADLVLGQADFSHRDENGGAAPSATSMRWPHALASWRNGICVADAGNNRVMVWNALPRTDNRACDAVLGQRGFDRDDHNAAEYWPSAASLNMPYGLAAAGDWLLVADTANSRLLGWHRDDCATGAAARALTGQAGFERKGDNRWGAPVADSLCWSYGLAHCDGLVAVADSGNNRVLIWALASELAA